MRQKPDKPILTDDQIDELLGEYRQLEDEIEIRKSRMDRAVTKIKETFRAAVQSPRSRMKYLKDQIHTSLWLRRSEFIKPRSRTLTHGKIGIRKVREDKFTVSSYDLAVASIRRNKLPETLIVIEEKVDLNVLAAHLKDHPDDLAKIDGITRPSEDEEPWFETIDNAGKSA